MSASSRQGRHKKTGSFTVFTLGSAAGFTSGRFQQPFPVLRSLRLWPCKKSPSTLFYDAALAIKKGPPLPSCLFRSQISCRIGKCRFYRMKTDRGKCYQNGKCTGKDKHPPAYIDTVRKILQPFIHKIPTDRRCHK